MLKLGLSGSENFSQSQTITELETDSTLFHTRPGSGDGDVVLVTIVMEAVVMIVIAMILVVMGWLW